MKELESTSTDYLTELADLSHLIELAQLNENVIEREARLNFLMEEYWWVEALLADLRK